MVCGLGDIGSEKKFFMMVRITLALGVTLLNWFAGCGLVSFLGRQVSVWMRSGWLGVRACHAPPSHHVLLIHGMWVMRAPPSWGIVGCKWHHLCGCSPEPGHFILLLFSSGAPSFPLAKESTGCSGRALNLGSKVPSSNPDPATL